MKTVLKDMPERILMTKAVGRKTLEIKFSRPAHQVIKSRFKVIRWTFGKKPGMQLETDGNGAYSFVKGREMKMIVRPRRTRHGKAPFDQDILGLLCLLRPQEKIDVPHRPQTAVGIYGVRQGRTFQDKYIDSRLLIKSQHLVQSDGHDLMTLAMAETKDVESPSEMVGQ